MRQAAPTREGCLRTIDQTAHRGAARLIPVHINELPSPRRASAHRRGPPRTARPKPPSAYSADGGFQLPATRLSATIQFNPRSSGALVPQKEPGATILFIVVGTASLPGDHRMDLLYPAHDAERMMTGLEIGAGKLSGTENVHMRLLTTDAKEESGQPKKENIAAAFGDVKKKAKPTDVLLVYLSGNGQFLDQTTVFEPGGRFRGLPRACEAGRKCAGPWRKSYTAAIDTRSGNGKRACRFDPLRVERLSVRTKCGTGAVERRKTYQASASDKD